MKTVLITGATSGIGRQLALDYLHRKWRVIACGRNAEALAELSLLGAEIHSFDLTDNTPLESLLPLEPSRTVDLVILNAGVCDYVDQGELTHQVMARTFAVNLIDQVRLFEYLLPWLKQTPNSQLALISSASVYLPFVRAEAYGSSKAALRYLGQVLFNSLKPYDIQVTTVLLGFIDTPLTQKNDFDMPALASVEDASRAIVLGLEKRKPQILFPYLFCRILSLFECLPVSLKLKLAGYLAKPDKTKEL